MNILAAKQNTLLKIEASSEEYEQCYKEFISVYYKLRDKEDRCLYNRLSVRQRQILHPLLLEIYRIKNRLGGFSYEIIGDKRSKTDKPVIFAVTHVGKFDIEVVSEAIKTHYYLLSGDFEHLQGTIDAPFLALNGVIYFNERVAKDRQSAKERMIRLLQEGGNLMYFPEGTWNLSPNLPVLPCYWGIIDIAREGGAMIVPVAAEQYGKHFKINIGKNINMNIYGKENKEKTRAITELRDELATLKYEIWETVLAKRSELEINEWEQQVEKRLSEWPYFDLDNIEGMIYHPKNVSSPQEVFDFLDKLIPSSKNAFLLRAKYESKRK